MTDFVVKVGFHTINISAKDGTDAIVKARDWLYTFWPNHVQMIRDKPDAAFIVERVH